MNRIISTLCLSSVLSMSITTGTMADAVSSKPMVEEAQYAKNVTEYSKELVAAAFTARWCGEYHLAVNEQYFNFKSPGILWDKKRFDEYTEAVMMQMRKKIDAIYLRIGHDAYCKGYMEFAKKNRTFYGMAVNFPAMRR
jgi:hypothetical protein